MNDAPLSPDSTAGAEPRKPYVVVTPTPPRFPDVLAEVTRAQPLTMLAVAFIAGMVLAAGWRR